METLCAVPTSHWPAFGQVLLAKQSVLYHVPPQPNLLELPRLRDDGLEVVLDLGKILGCVDAINLGDHFQRALPRIRGFLDRTWPLPVAEILLRRYDGQDRGCRVGSLRLHETGNELAVVGPLPRPINPKEPGGWGVYYPSPQIEGALGSLFASHHARSQDYDQTAIYQHLQHRQF